MTTEPAAAPARKTLSVDATWDGGYKCRVKARAFEILVDEPSSAGGEDTGPQPTEVLLAALASCFTLAVYHVAAKRGVELPDLAVRAAGEYQGPMFARMVVEVTSSLDPTVFGPLVERAKAVCYVSNTLRAVNDVDVVIRRSPGFPASSPQ